MGKSDRTEGRKAIRTAEKGKHTGKLHRYQQESRQQPKQTTKKKSMDRER